MLLDNLTKSKYSDLVELKCDNCKNIFTRKKRDVLRSQKRGLQEDFCSITCRSNFQRETVICKQCKKTFNVIQYRKEKAKFCSQSCAAKYNNLRKLYTEKVIVCKQCGIEKIVKRKKRDIFICLSCKRKNKKCSICGERRCSKSICKSLRAGRLKVLIQYFGFDETKLGTRDVFKEVSKIKDIFYDEYITNKESLLTISKKYGNVWFQTILNIFDFFGIESRTIKQAGKIAYQQGRAKQHTIPITGTQQWHTTWDAREVFLRSNLELKFAKELDKQEKYYEVESLRISYFTVDGYQSTYIPDFYIPSENLVIEIKGSFFVNDNDVLKAQATRKEGYNYKYILDGKEKQI